MSDEETPPGWRVDHRRQYTPAGSSREMEYVTYRHESGDVRVRVAPASLDGGDDEVGYAVTTTIFPGFEFAESARVRSVLRFEGCDEIARRLMTLFSTQYDGPGSVERALEYATDRVRPSGADDQPVEVPEITRESSE